MACMNISRMSSSLKKQTQLNIVVPDTVTEKPMKVLYLLHGLKDDASCWTRFTSLEQFVKGNELVVVMPDGGRGFYHDTIYGENYFEYITKELPEWIEFLLPISKEREDTFIAGLSMGGYGAMKAALTYPEQYAGVAAFSPVCDVRRHFADDSLPVKCAFGETPDWSSLDLFELANKTQISSCKPKIFQWCGTSDFLYQDNKKFQAHMENLNYDYHFFESEGDHMWKYWNEQVENALVFFNLTKKQ